MKILLVLLQALLLLSGAGTVEELDESELERFEHLASNPVCINLVSANRLQSCGLFSAYQAASILNYISENGDILSATELGTVPGFTPDLAAALKKYVSFESYSSGPHRRSLRQNVRVRSVNGKHAGKYSLEYGERVEFHLSAKDAVSASLAVSGKRPWKVVAGDFNARLGQGLLAWSGFSLSGVPSPGSVRKNASGFSPTGSFSPSHRGVAADYCGRTWKAGAALDSEGALLAFGGWQGRTATAGINCISRQGLTGVSADASVNVGHLCIFGEACVFGSPAALAGAIWEPAYKTGFSVLARYYSPGYSSPFAGAVRSGSKVRDEAGFSAGFCRKWLSATADMSLHPEKLSLRKSNYQQFKSIVDASPEFSFGRTVFSPSLRWVEKMQLSPASDGVAVLWRHDLRTDLKVSRNGLQACLRLNAVQTGEHRPGELAYLEIGYRTPSDSARLQLSAFLRGTACSTDGWASRVYSYERDIPGFFNVPAWYGKRHGLSFVAGLSYRRSRTLHRINLYASLKDFKVQYQLQIHHNSGRTFSIRMPREPLTSMVAPEKSS
jgi:hypothetical protein